MNIRILAAIALATPFAAVAQQTRSYNYAGPTALYDGTSRVNSTDYTQPELCVEAAVPYLATKRAADAKSKNITVRCETKRYITNELLPAWYLIAYQGQPLAFGSSTSVRYGIGPNWVQKSMQGAGSCTGSFFGTPTVAGATCEAFLSTFVPAPPVPAPSPAPVPPPPAPVPPPPAPTPPAPAPTPAPAPPPVRVGLGTLPANPIVSPGWSEARIQATSDRGVPASDGVGAFRTVCNTSHYAYDDPIVYPNQPGRSHMHAFYGNTLTNAASTTASLTSSGNGTCAGGVLNRSAYWIPVMIDTATGQVVHAVPDVVFYYKTEYGGVVNSTIKPFPTGLRMIAGDSMNSSENWTRAYQWVCHNNYPQHGFTMQNCAVGDELELKVSFPQCWDGVNLDSPDHKSHMAYAQGGCPASHPVPLPGLSVNVRWAITRPNQASTWRLSSDVYNGPAGYSAHADFWAAWDAPTMKTFVENCINPGRDCHAYLLGDDRMLY